ncbi:MAG: glycosyltransferase [Ferruginibacter sp.]|nr:glycosyltransferase [Ferruginibacter sp.]
MAITNKKILFISHDGMTDPLGQSQVIPYLAGLTKFGYAFTILSCDKRGQYAANKDYVKALIAPYLIEWVSVPYHKNIPVLSAVYDFYQLKKTAKKLQETNHFDMVHTRPGIPTLIALYLKKKYNLRFLNDIRGFWADERVDGGIWDLRNPVFKLVYKFFKKHEHECLLRADYTTCLTYAARKEIHTRKNIPNQPIPIEVIPCSADMNLFDINKIDPNLKKIFKADLNLHDDDFVITYLGSIGGWYLTDEMMRFCKKVANKIPNAKFLFISPHSHGEIAAAAIKWGLAAEKLIVRQAKRHEVPILLSFSSYAVFFIKACYSKLSSSPTKHGEIMAMGIPVITNTGVGDVAEIVTKYNGGYLVNDFSDRSLNDVIEKIVAGNTFSKSIIRKGAKDFYSLETAVDRYRKVYSKIFA